MGQVHHGLAYGYDKGGERMTTLKGIVNSRTKDLRHDTACMNCSEYHDDSIKTMRRCRKCPCWNKDEDDNDIDSE